LLKICLELKGFIKGILDYSRNARAEIDYQKIDFDQLLKESTSSLQLISQYEKLIITTKIESQTSFYSDPLRLSVVFNNLLSNAIKFQDSSKPTSIVSVTIFVDDREARIEVSDNGIGIEASHVPKIFDMFYRGTTRTDGSGIGLYIVKETIEKLNGTIVVDSKLGEFTTFTILLRNEMVAANASKENEIKRVIEQLADKSSLSQTKMVYSLPSTSPQIENDSSGLAKE
jgi:signal transduction histidine kinase